MPASTNRKKGRPRRSPGWIGSRSLPGGLGRGGELDASAGALVLPGFVHKLRNLLLRAGLEGGDLARGRSMEELARLLDLVGPASRGGGGQLWLDGATPVMLLIGECLGHGVQVRGLRYRLDVQGRLPGLAVPPPRMLLWAAAGLRHILAQVPEGMRGCVTLQARRRRGTGLLRCRMAFQSAPGFLPLGKAPAPFREATVFSAAQEGLRLSVGRGTGPRVAIEAPLRPPG